MAHGTRALPRYVFICAIAASLSLIAAFLSLIFDGRQYSTEELLRRGSLAVPQSDDGICKAARSKVDTASSSFDCIQSNHLPQSAFVFVIDIMNRLLDSTAFFGVRSRGGLA